MPSEQPPATGTSPQSPFGRLLAAAASRPQAAGVICSLLATLIWSGNFIAGRSFVGAFPPVTAVALRGSLAFLLLLPFALPQFKRERPVIRANLKFLALASLLGLTIPHCGVYIAATYSPAMNLSIISICTPLFVLVMARVFFNEYLNRVMLLGLAVTISGILLLLSKGDFSALAGLRFDKGELVMFCNVLGFALYTLMIRKMPKGIGMISFLLVFTFLGTLFTWPGALWEMAQGYQIRFSWGILGGLLYVSIGPSLAAYGFWNAAIALIGAARTSVVYYLLPLFCGIEAFLFLGEPVLAVHLISMALIVAGLFVALRAGRSAARR